MKLGLELFFEPEQEMEAMLLLELASGIAEVKMASLGEPVVLLGKTARDQGPEAKESLGCHQLLVEADFSSQRFVRWLEIH